jgi:L-ribulose-5-phosphate 3-epimerase
MSSFAVNTYSYTFGWPAAECIRHLAAQGYTGIELMMYPGHLWPDLDAAGRRGGGRCGAWPMTAACVSSR